MSTATLDIGEARSGEGLSSTEPLASFDLDRSEEMAPWHRESREAARRHFQTLAMPSRTDETWRFSSLKALHLQSFTSPAPVTDEQGHELIERSAGLREIAGKMVFGNDRLLVREAGNEALRQLGVIWLPLAEAAAKHPELVQKHFMREEAILGSRKFAALHEARVSNGTFLYLPPGVQIDLPIESFHWLHGSGGSCFPHTLIVAAENSRATFVDYFRSSENDAPGFACGVNDLWVGPGAHITYINCQQWSGAAAAVQINSTVLGRDAAAVALTAHFGGSYVRNESISHLRGKGGRSDMLALAVADGRREIDQRTLQIHEAPNTASDLLYKNALDDRAHTIFSGLIRVAPEAHFTDAYQKVRNLLLSDEAEADSAPGLEIKADNVRCTHGATTGEIEAEELFYLLSRGIPRNKAQRLIVFGFLNEVIERLPNRDEQIREYLQCALHTRFLG